VDVLIEKNRAGWLLRGLNDEAYDEALVGIGGLLAEGGLRCRLHEVARQELSLEGVGGPLYDKLYSRLIVTETNSQ
jgi:hypothetical protein